MFDGDSIQLTSRMFIMDTLGAENDPPDTPAVRHADRQSIENLMQEQTKLPFRQIQKLFDRQKTFKFDHKLDASGKIVVKAHEVPAAAGVDRSVRRTPPGYRLHNNDHAIYTSEKSY